MRLFLLASLCLMPLMSTPAYADKTVTCTAVDKKAAVGVSDTTSVAVTVGDKTCSFSIGGASVNAREKQAFVQGINDLLAGNFDNLSAGSQKADSFSILLAPGKDDDQSFIVSFNNVSRNHLSDFGRCIRAFRSGTSSIMSFTGGFQNSSVMCRMAPPQGSWSEPISVVGAMLQIGVVVQGTGYFVLISPELIQAGDRGYRLR